MYPGLNSLHKSRLFVIPAESADGVDYLVDFLQRLTVHEAVEFLEVGFDGFVIKAAGFVIGIEQHLQDILSALSG